MYRPIPNEIFHVHTWRCEHAGEEQDCEYVKKAIELGASRIVFTDHCPFPGNPFRKRIRSILVCLRQLLRLQRLDILTL